MDGPIIAQAGARCFNAGTLSHGFGTHAEAVQFWANDSGGTVSEEGQWTPPAALVGGLLAVCAGEGYDVGTASWMSEWNAVRAPQPEALSMDAVVTAARRANEAAEKEPTP